MILVYTLCFLHLAFFLWLSWRWNRIRELDDPEIEHDLPGVSVIVPVRNEAENIATLLQDILRQEYTGSLEVLVIDDHSTDETANQVSQFEEVVYQALPDGQGGKKAATSAGVRLATYDHIVCTDGDCRMNSKWLSTIIGFMQDRDLKMVTGPVRLTSASFFGQLQAVEFDGLIAFGAISLSIANPGMCNGANLAYRKYAFEAVDGYAGNAHIPSGDDEFLLQKIHQKYPGEVMFCKSPNAEVSTPSKHTVGKLFNQRRRWTSKWKFHKSWYIKLSAILGFLDFFIGTALLVLIWLWDYQLVAGALLIRFVGELYFFHQVARWHDYRALNLSVLVLSLIYPLYAVILGIASIFGTYSWKGRHY